MDADRAASRLTFAGLAYGAATAAFSAWSMGPTYDELKFYNRWGLEYLADPVKFTVYDHPPFSWWLGSQIPSWTGWAAPWAFRIAAVAVYVLVGMLVVRLLRGAGKAWAAAVFALFYGFDPTVKALASLQLTELSGFLVLAACACVWAYAQERRAGLLAGAGFAIGLAGGTKITAFLFCPFLAAAYFLAPDGRETWRRDWGLILGCALLGLFAAYRGYPGFLSALMKSFEFQAEHSGRGHLTALFSRYSHEGFWYYFLVLLPFKTPPLFLGLGAAALWDVRRAKKLELVLLLAPALLLLVLLSRGKVQIGARYFLPGLLLLYLFGALSLQRLFESMKPRAAAAALGVLFALVAAADAAILWTGAYLPYFNVMTPEPTRAFIDSNNDWLQGLPRHVAARYAHARPTEELFDFLASDREEQTFLVGATELGGVWGSPLAPHLRIYRPEAAPAGYEVLRANKDDLYAIMSARRPFGAYGFGAERDDLLKAGIRPEGRACPAGTELRTLSKPVLKELWIERGSSGAGPDTLAGKASLKRAPESVLFLELGLGGTTSLDGKKITFNQRAHRPPVLMQHWSVLRGSPASVAFRQESDRKRSRAGYFPYFRALQLWQECAPAVTSR